jgi:hypothetical protein
MNTTGSGSWAPSSHPSVPVSPLRSQNAGAAARGEVCALCTVSRFHKYCHVVSAAMCRQSFHPSTQGSLPGTPGSFHPSTQRSRAGDPGFFGGTPA